MTDKVRARLIVERWSSGITRDDRKHDKMQGIFSSLAEDLFYAGIAFDSAYTSIKEAAKLMYPPAHVVKKYFSSLKHGSHSTVQDFARSWHENIDKTALEAFYQFYEIEGATKRSDKNQKPAGMKTDDELNEEDFWKSVKSVTKDNPWIFSDEDQ
jgi:hypothetical protein